MRIRWAPAARDDVEGIGDYIAQHDRGASVRIVDRLTGTARVLATSPGIGRSGRVEGTREFVVSGTPYIVVYRLSDDLLEIVRILHSARLWPKTF